MPASVDVKYLKSLLENNKKPFSKIEGWLYFLVYSDDKGRINKSLRNIANDIGWSIGKVRLFIDAKKDTIIRDKSAIVFTEAKEIKLKYKKSKAKEEKPVQEIQAEVSPIINLEHETQPDVKSIPIQPEERKVKPKDYIDQIVDIFAEEYQNTYKIDYTIEKGKDRSAASKILSEYKKVYKFSDSEGTLSGLRNFFKMALKIDDKWMQDNMSLSIIRNKFNTVKKFLRNGQYRQSDSEQSDEINSIVNSVFNATGNR